jgi:transposase
VAGAGLALPRSGCPAGTFSEAHDVAPPRIVLTTRAVAWATNAVSSDDTTVSASARHLGVDWHTAWDAIEAEARPAPPTLSRLKGSSISPWLQKLRSLSTADQARG